MIKTQKNISRLIHKNNQSRKRKKISDIKKMLKNRRPKSKRKYNRDLQNKTLKMRGGISTENSKIVKGAEQFNKMKTKTFNLIQSINKSEKGGRAGSGITKKYIDEKTQNKIYKQIMDFIKYVSKLPQDVRKVLSENDKRLLNLF